uniref:Uncharacterized protein n=1 Tax=Caenorhabditis japonica TaxID=281687 RepID=A0A8R1ELG3_CAEJA
MVHKFALCHIGISASGHDAKEEPLRSVHSPEKLQYRWFAQHDVLLLCTVRPGLPLVWVSKRSGQTTPSFPVMFCTAI